MAYDLELNKDGIIKEGGKYWAYKRVNEDGTNTTPPDTWHIGSYVKEAKITFDTEKEEISDWHLDTVKTILGKRTFKISLTLLQSDVETINFILNEVSGKYFTVFLQTGKEGSKYQELYIPIAEIAPKAELTMPGDRNIEIEITALITTGDITPTNLPTFAYGGSGNTSAWEVEEGNYCKWQVL